MRIRADASGLIKRWERVHQNLENEMIGAIREAANIVPQACVEALNASIVRRNESEGTLGKSIDGTVIHTDKKIIAGIGNMEEMTAKAPYWQMIDEGSGVKDRTKSIVGRWIPGWFVDSGGNRVPFDGSRTPGSPSSDRFFYIKGQGSYMVIRNEIKPHHYFLTGRNISRPKISAKFAEGMKRAFRT